MQDEFIDDQPPIGTLTPEARESLRLAIADTPSDHPDRAGHTPGPWTLHDIGYGIRIGDIAWIGFGSAYSKEEHRANARLIASSPDLLEACQIMSGCHGVTSWAMESLSLPERNAVRMIRAAIAKATGRQEP